MSEFNIHLHSLNDSFSFQVASQNEEDITKFIYSFFSLFPGVNLATKRIESLHYNTAQLRTNINVFVNKFSDKLPSLNAVAAFFNRMPDNEPFYFIPFKTLTLDETISINNYLTALKAENKDFNALQQETNDLFGDLIKDYSIMAFGKERKSIGEREKSKRVCRFCNNTRSNASFNKKAHAISEALGNKTIVLLEECDGCNEHFSKTIEPDLIEYFSLFRTIYGIKGKGGNKDFIGRNFQLIKKDTLQLKFESEDDSIGPSLPMTIPLNSHQDIALQNIYKTLCKYFLSVIPSEYLVYFKETIRWINGDQQISSLPRIATLMSDNNLALQPELITYVRTSNDATIPYAIGEFHFALYRYVFIVPLSSKDDNQFIVDAEYAKFWKKFKHYNMVKGWKFENFSNNVKRPFSINLRFDFTNSQQDETKID